MEELLLQLDPQFLQELVDAINEHATRKWYDEGIFWVAVASAVVSVVITSFIYYRQSAILKQQNKIALFDKRALIYETYIESRQILDFHSFEKYASLGISDKIFFQIDKIMKMQDEIFIQYNKAKFLCNDDSILLGKLKVIADKYVEISEFYIKVLPKYIEISDKALEFVYKKFPTINNVQSLMQNEQAKEMFAMQCTTADSKSLEALITQYRENFTDEYFDIHFKKYLTIE